MGRFDYIWGDYDQYEEDEELADEFEKILGEIATGEKCKHVWEKTGESPNTGELWYNCEKCSIPKEKA